MVGAIHKALLSVTAMGAAALLTGNSPAPADDFPHAPLTLDGEAGQVELHFVGDMAALTFRSADGTARPLRAIETPGDSLAVLADPRLAFAEPALLAWAGNDLTAQRDRMVARAKAAMEMSLPAMMPNSDAERWSGGTSLTATLQYMRVLTATGHTADAIAFLRDRLAKLPTGSAPSDDHTRLTTRLANILFDNGHEEEAVALLDAESGALPVKSESRANLDINLAALLVRSGHFQRGFALVDLTWRSFMGSNPDEIYAGSTKVPGSDAQFAWIRACALNGLGQKDKAHAIMAAITDIPPELPNEIGSTAGARIQGYYCMKDADDLAKELAAQLAIASPAGDILLAFDPLGETYLPDRETLKAALKSPVLVKAMAGHVRPLTRFAAAVSRWRTPS